MIKHRVLEKKRLTFPPSFTYKLVLNLFLTGALSLFWLSAVSFSRVYSWGQEYMGDDCSVKSWTFQRDCDSIKIRATLLVLGLRGPAVLWWGAEGCCPQEMWLWSQCTAPFLEYWRSAGPGPHQACAVLHGWTTLWTERLYPCWMSYVEALMLTSEQLYYEAGALRWLS